MYAHIIFARRLKHEIGIDRGHLIPYNLGVKQFLRHTLD